MTSVLASQLQTLARQRQPALPTAIRKGKPSLLFYFQKAADVDLQTIYDIACQGLEDLTRLEPRFRPYRESLFSRASLDINPELQTPEFLSKLSESIYGFCCLLSNHFLAPPAFKVLEYLIRRYKANERNVDALMMAALPYHSTNEFVRLVQTLALGAQGSLWGWLAKMQTSGASLPRDLLAQRCANDRQLLLFICKAASQLGGASLGAAGSGASALRGHNRVFLSFYAVLLCEVLAVLPTVGEDFLAALLPHLLEGLGRGAAQDYRAATLMAVAELFSRATLGKDFIKVLVNTMLKQTEPVPEHIRTTLLVMTHMAVTQQHIRSLSDKTLKLLSALPNAVSELVALSQRGNIRTGPLLMLIVRSLTASLSDGGNASRRAEGDLLSLAHSGALSGEPARFLASTLLEAGIAAAPDAFARETCHKILRVLDQRYPETTDAAVNTFLEPVRVRRKQQLQRTQLKASALTGDDRTKKKRKSKRQKEDAAGGMAETASDDGDCDDDVEAETAEAVAAALTPEDRMRFEFVRATFASGGYSAPCGGTMLTLAAALTAPQAAVRRMALQQLDADLGAAPHASASGAATSEARMALTSAALTRLRDDDLGVVVAALGLSCLKQLPPSALLDALAPLVNRIGELLYGSGKSSNLKWARKAARKALSLLKQVGLDASGEIQQATALHMLALMPPSLHDPFLAVEAARGAAGLGIPLFAEMAMALESAEAQLKATNDAARGGKTSEGAEDGVPVHMGKKAAQKAAAAIVDRAIVSALAKALALNPVAGSSVKYLVAASAAAAVVGGEAAEAAARRVQHLLLLASYAAATTSCMAGESPSALSLQLLRYVVDMAVVLLPYARRAGDGDSGWVKAFAKQVSTQDGLPTDAHTSVLKHDSVAAHAALILGTLQSSLMRLPEPTNAVQDAEVLATAKRVLSVLASLGYSLSALGDLPVLIVTRAVDPASRSSFLSGIYAAPTAASPGDDAPATGGGATEVAPLQSLALHVYSQVVNVECACQWFVSLLPALASHAEAVRSAACDCAAALGMRLSAAQHESSVSGALSPYVAMKLCKALDDHRKLLCLDSEAILALLRGALHGGSVAGSAALLKVALVSLPEASVSELTSYMTSAIGVVGVDAAGVNTARLVLTCLVPTEGDSSIGPELFAAGCTYLAQLVKRLRSDPYSASGLDAGAVELLIASLFTPGSVAVAIAAGNEALLSCLAEAAELLPAAGTGSNAPAPCAAALAAIRLAAVRQVSGELIAALPFGSRTVRELFAVLLARYEGDPDEEVRAASRSALENVPLAAELLVPLLDPIAEDASTAGRSKKRIKSESAATRTAVSEVLSSAILRDAVAVLELLQWRSGISSPHLLVAACQSLLSRLRPYVGSVVSVSKADGSGGDGNVAAAAEEDQEDAAAGGKSSLAGYASTLALQVLAALARNCGDEAMGDADKLSSRPLFDLELAVHMAREAPDAAVRNAALGLLAALAKIMPEVALLHVLQVLAVINQSAALQDDDHSRAVGGAVLAAVVPAWVAAGRRPATLWEQVVSSLPSLPTHHRLDVLLALMRALPEIESGLSDGLLVLLQHTADRVERLRVDAHAGGAPSPSEWLPELASQLALQAELPVRLAACARVMEMSLAASGQQAHKALPRTVVVFVTAQLKLKAATTAASAQFRRPEPNPALDLGCQRLMEAALAQMQMLHPDSAAASSVGEAPALTSAATPAKTAEAVRHRAVLAASRGLYGLFGALQGVMAPDTYLQSLLTLAEHPADRVKRRALKLFTDKVRGVRSEVQDRIELPQRIRTGKLRVIGEAAARACALLPSLLVSSSAASPLTRQLALLALSTIAAEFGGQQQAALLAGVQAVLAATKDSHASIRAGALATMAAFVRALEARLVPVLPETVAAAVAAADFAMLQLAAVAGAEQTDAALCNSDDLDGGEEDSDDGEGDPRARKTGGAEDVALELSSALACLNALVETVGGFLSPHLPAVLGILLNPRVLACSTAGCDKFAASIRARLPTVVPPRLLLPALYDRLEPCIAAAGDASSAVSAASPTVTLLQMFASAAAALEARLAAQHCDAMFAFVLRAMDVRQRRPSTLAVHGEAAIDAVESAGISALVALVMKISEARFKPLFLRLVEWASTVSVPEMPGAAGEPSYLGRMVTLFGAISALVDRLRSVLVPYFRYVLDFCVAHLAGDELGGGRSARKSKKQRRSIAPPAEQDEAADSDAAAYRDQQLCLTWLLRLRIVRALHRCFLHDSVSFVDPDRFARLQPALVSTLSSEPPDITVPFLLAPQHADADLASYMSLGRSTRVYTAPDGEASLGPLGAATVSCLVAMAVAAASDALWKPLNHGALMVTRSASARSRALALEVVAQLVDRLREEYLVLLPEALPFLSELLEDADAAVAARVREVVAQLEEISGEKLDEYLRV